MTIIAEIQRVNKKYPHVNVAPDLLATCDECGREFTITRMKKCALSNRHHYCSRCCSISSFTTGTIRSEINEKLAALGVSNISQLSEVRDKVKKTCLEKFGHATNLASDETKNKRRATFLEKYGVEVASKSDVVREKISETKQTTTQEEKERIKAKVRDKIASRTEEDKHKIREKAKRTMIERYGAECSFQSPMFKERSNSTEACRKRFETMKRNGTYGKSKPEDELFKILCDNYGVENVVRQVMLPETRWPIDFYVVPIDTYIQLDGVYWHGIGRDVNEVAEYKTKRDVMIHKKMSIDLAQNEWFKANRKTLLRITDKEFKTMGINSLKTLLMNDKIDWEIVEERVKKAKSIAQEVK